MPVLIPAIKIALPFLILLSSAVFFSGGEASSSTPDVLVWFVLGYRLECLSPLPFPFFPLFIVSSGWMRSIQYEKSSALLLNKSG